MKSILPLTMLLTLTSFAGIIEPHTKWKKNNITVCFANSASDINGKISKVDPKTKYLPFTELQKDLIIRTIEREFTTERTGIHFTGWEDCETGKEADAIIAKAKAVRFLGFTLSGPTYAGLSSIGQDGDLSQNLARITGKTPLVSFTEFTPMTIVHEFGHLAGLRHEHIHQDASKDVNCLRMFQQSTKSYLGLLARSIDRFYDYTKAVTEYDPQSVMNYCSTLGVNDRKELLTILDQKTLKQEYSELIIDGE